MKTEPFFTDQTMITNFNKDVQPCIQAANGLLKTFETATGFKVESIAQLIELSSDPQKVIVYHNEKKNRAEIQKITAMGYNLPVNFDKICNGMFEDIKRLGKTLQAKLERSNSDYLELKNGEVVLSDFAKEYIKRKSCHYATTAEERQRLAISDSFIAAYKQAADHVLSYYKNEPPVVRAVENKFHTGQLPYYVLRVGNTLVPNPQFIKQCFDGTNHLGFHIYSEAEKARALRDQQPRLGKKHYKFRQVIGNDVRHFLVEEKDFDRYKDRKDLELVDGFWSEEDKPFGTPLGQPLPNSKIFDTLTSNFK